MIHLHRRPNAGPVLGIARGQGLVEFALMIPILVVLVIGALDFGMAFYYKVVLTNSAREGANYVVYHAGTEFSEDETKNAVQVEGANSGVSIAADDIAVQCLDSGGIPATGCPHGSMAVVSATYPMDLLVEVIFHGPLQLRSEARMLVP